MFRNCAPELAEEVHFDPKGSPTSAHSSFWMRQGLLVQKRETIAWKRRSRLVLCLNRASAGGARRALYAARFFRQLKAQMRLAAIDAGGVCASASRNGARHCDMGGRLPDTGRLDSRKECTLRPSRSGFSCSSTPTPDLRSFSEETIDVVSALGWRARTRLNMDIRFFRAPQQRAARQAARALQQRLVSLLHAAREHRSRGPAVVPLSLRPCTTLQGTGLLKNAPRSPSRTRIACWSSRSRLRGREKRSEGVERCTEDGRYLRDLRLLTHSQKSQAHSEE